MNLPAQLFFDHHSLSGMGCIGNDYHSILTDIMGYSAVEENKLSFLLTNGVNLCII